MLNFKTIELTDKKLLDSYLTHSGYRICDFSFSNLFCWQGRYETCFDIVNGFLVIRFLTVEEKLPVYMMPVGSGNLQKVIRILMDDARINNYPFRMMSITQEMFLELDKCFPDTFTYTPLRGSADYIYETENLILLKGKKYQSKRNHINKFKSEHPDYEFSLISRENISECLDMMHKRWCIQNGCDESDMLHSESYAVRKALKNFEALQLSGGVIRTNAKIVAFSFGQAITEDTFGVHVEKAEHAMNGAYTIINQQVAEHIGCDYKYMNREEDLGLESLRKAKLSYNPAILLEKGLVQLK
ncbi:MAG: phosphatidylglycerol lysyltransferase domain-containing protein [Candidatus Azobacteroides sp.]|nr:phosphatidylglycerol lysyltransferase domain-containing protein [Candidatus Azobacteroides sp.]